MAQKLRCVFALLTFTCVTLSWGQGRPAAEWMWARGTPGDRGQQVASGQRSLVLSQEQPARDKMLSRLWSNRARAELGQRPWAAEGPPWPPG